MAGRRVERTGFFFQSPLHRGSVVYSWGGGRGQGPTALSVPSSSGIGRLLRRGLPRRRFPCFQSPLHRGSVVYSILAARSTRTYGLSVPSSSGIGRLLALELSNTSARSRFQSPLHRGSVVYRRRNYAAKSRAPYLSVPSSSGIGRLPITWENFSILEASFSPLFIGDRSFTEWT